MHHLVHGDRRREEVTLPVWAITDVKRRQERLLDRVSFCFDIQPLVILPSTTIAAAQPCILTLGRIVQTISSLPLLKIGRP